MGVVDSFKAVLEDKKTLLIGTIIGIIPGINFLNVEYHLNILNLGYYLKIAKNKGQLPEYTFDDEWIVKAIMGVIIGAIYATLFIIVATVVDMVLPPGLNPITILTMIQSDFTGVLAKFGSLAVVCLIIDVIYILISTAAVITYGKEGHFGAAFSGQVIETAFSWEFIKTYIIAGILAAIIFGIWSIVLGMVAMIFPPLRLLFALPSFWVTAAMFKALTEAS